MTDAASAGAGALVSTALGAAAAEEVGARWLRRLLGNRNVIGGGAIFLLFLLAAILAPALASHNPTRLDPLARLKPPNAVHYLGTDEFGRDVYSLVLYGSRVSLLVGGVTMLLTSLGGVVIGLAAGY